MRIQTAYLFEFESDFSGNTRQGKNQCTKAMYLDWYRLGSNAPAAPAVCREVVDIQ
jgi:hypothetical protein